MVYKYYSVGRIILYKGDKLLVSPTPNNTPICAKCYFSKHYCATHNIKESACYKHGMLCTAHMRKDKRHVVFIKQD